MEINLGGLSLYCRIVVLQKPHIDHTITSWGKAKTLMMYYS